MPILDDTIAPQGGEKPLHDEVQSPTWYTQGNIECLDYILAKEFGFLAGQVIKYVTRYKRKGQPVRDLEKARFYLNKLIERGGRDAHE